MTTNNIKSYYAVVYTGAGKDVPPSEASAHFETPEDAVREWRRQAGGGFFAVARVDDDGLGVGLRTRVWPDECCEAAAVEEERDRERERKRLNRQVEKKMGLRPGELGG